MRKEFILGTVVGGVICGSIGVFAGQYVANTNPFPIQLNGKNVNIEGYNINDSTYFKLRDIADVVGGFTVDFNNNTIQLSKDGYNYQTTEVQPKANTDSKIATPSGTPQPIETKKLSKEDLEPTDVVDMNTILTPPLDTADEVREYYTNGDFYYGGNFYAQVNSAGGVSLNWCAKNISDKAIKYIHMTIRLYNSVGDQITDRLGYKTFKETVIGPIEPNAGFRYMSHRPFAYTYDCSKLSIDEIEVEFMDGTTAFGLYSHSTTRIR